jgi:hypothetical protein
MSVMKSRQQTTTLARLALRFMQGNHPKFLTKAELQTVRASAYGTKQTCPYLLRHRSDRPKRRLTTDQMAFVAGRHVALA